MYFLGISKPTSVPFKGDAHKEWRMKTVHQEMLSAGMCRGVVMFDFEKVIAV